MRLLSEKEGSGMGMGAKAKRKDHVELQRTLEDCWQMMVEGEKKMSREGKLKSHDPAMA